MNKTRVKNAVKQARAAIVETPQSSAEAMRKAMSTLGRAVAKGTLHRRNAARRIGRLAKQAHAAQQAA